MPLFFPRSPEVMAPMNDVGYRVQTIAHVFNYGVLDVTRIPRASAFDAPDDLQQANRDVAEALLD